MTSQNDAGDSVLVGWASRDFTPSRASTLRGQFHVRVSKGVDDPVTVTALAFESASPGAPRQQAIVISCDIVGVSENVHSRIREALRGRLDDFDLNMLFAHATHTHSAPTLDEGIYPPQDASVMTPTECAALICTSSTN